ncbi:MAG: VWA domain-containing protein [bacterium]
MRITFLWPALLWGLLLIPLLAVLYVRVLRRPARHPVSFSTQGTIAHAAAASQRFRRHMGAALFGIGAMLLVLTTARPVAPIPVPADRAAIMLAIDVSGSMRSQDILPTRLEAAKTAATAFSDSLPDRVRIGLVAFAGFATVLVPPTLDHQRVKDAMTGLGYARRTAIGEGLLESVAALPGRVRPGPDGALPPALPGPRPSGIVVLLSDGNSNYGIAPLDAAEIARRQEVTVYTVGIGQPMSTGAWQIGGSLDQETLQSIATITGGTYYHASSAEGLRHIYRRLARSIGWERRPTEISAVTATGATVLLLASLSISWILMHPAGL